MSTCSEPPSAVQLTLSELPVEPLPANGTGAMGRGRKPDRELLAAVGLTRMPQMPLLGAATPLHMLWCTCGNKSATASEHAPRCPARLNDESRKRIWGKR